MVEFIRSKRTSFVNKPVGVVAADTGARQLQRLVDRRMQRRRRGFYEPAHGREGVLVSFCFLLLLFVLSFCCFITLRESKSQT